MAGVVPSDTPVATPPFAQPPCQSFCTAATLLPSAQRLSVPSRMAVAPSPPARPQRGPQSPPACRSLPPMFKRRREEPLPCRCNAEGQPLTTVATVRAAGQSRHCHCTRCAISLPVLPQVGVGSVPPFTLGVKWNGTDTSWWNSKWDPLKSNYVRCEIPVIWTDLGKIGQIFRAKM